MGATKNDSVDVDGIVSIGEFHDGAIIIRVFIDPSAEDGHPTLEADIVRALANVCASYAIQLLSVEHGGGQP